MEQLEAGRRLLLRQCCPCCPQQPGPLRGEGEASPAAGGPPLRPRSRAVLPILIPHLEVDWNKAEKVGSHLLPAMHGSLHQRSEAGLVPAVGVHAPVHQVLHPGKVALPARDEELGWVTFPNTKF